MAQQSLPASVSSAAERPTTKPIQPPDRNVRPLSASGPSHGPSPNFRNGHLNLDTFSPVNENGSFEFDRVLKRGKVYCRMKSKHAFKASWKPVYLVLRPNLLSVYKDEDEARLRLSITLTEVTAVAAVHSPRSHRDHVFGVFSPSKNYRFQALSEQDANDWIERIRSELCIDEEEEALFAQSRALSSRNYGITSDGDDQLSDHSDVGDVDRDITSSSPELVRTVSLGRGGRNLPFAQDYSGNEITEYSDLSDAPGSSTQQQRSVTSLPKGDKPHGDKNKRSSDVARAGDPGANVDPERVICHGYLQCLRSKHGVRQWKKVWVVLRPISLALYKDDREYCAIKIIPMSQVINAAEIDPISRSKTCCLQVITEDRPIYRFCAPDEESLAKWLGALKSVIVARKRAIEKERKGEGERERKEKAATATTATTSTAAAPSGPSAFQPLH
ncbi:PH domain protein [Rasamsonia emersonii CBS 393.64]|uniref:PH domain protein n=1 Tax=Rasamsonia emersonii (strain ATCC 16479 / CBS 393.64 / IMI 116815) TaxID=1408163 RepID=A0A0F4Z1R3_RASE3|nr:PH domain protein [Rasamsonia emersonii CBS 393.64]KKA24290.1 PH domain protein [Rasamsonia emersonii CBS 393.64]